MSKPACMGALTTVPGCCAGPAMILLLLGRTNEAIEALDTALRVRPSGILDMYTQLCAAHLAIVRGGF